MDVEVQGTVVFLLNEIYLDVVCLTTLNLQFFPTALDSLAGIPNVYERVTVNDQAQSVIAADVEYQCLVLLRCQGAFETGRDVFEVHIWCKDGVAAVAQSDATADCEARHGCSLHLRIVPVGNQKTPLTSAVDDITVTTLKHFVACQSTTLYESHLAIGVEHLGFAGDAVEGGDGMGGVAGIVAPHHHGVVGIRSHHDDVGSRTRGIGRIAEGQHLVLIL